MYSCYRINLYNTFDLTRFFRTIKPISKTYRIQLPKQYRKMEMLTKTLVFVTLFGAIAAQCDPSVTTASGTFAPQEICAGALIFSDEFDELNFKKWQHESTLAGGGNWEFQWYLNDRTSSWAENGKLHIRPTLTADFTGEEFLTSGILNINGGSPADECTNPQFYGCERGGSADNIINPIRSARLRTVESFSFKYGRIESVAKLPSGDWIWPAIWMMPRDNAYGSWPLSGEIDIMEGRGNKNLILNGQNIGSELVGSTMHWGPTQALNSYMRTHWEKNSAAGNGYELDYHKYELEWTPDYMAYKVDDEEIGRVAPPAGGFWEMGGFESSGAPNPWKQGTKMAPFDQEFYIILNVAAGGIAYFPDEATNPVNKPWSNTSPRAAADFWEGRGGWLPTWYTSEDASDMQVEYVRVYAL